MEEKRKTFKFRATLFGKVRRRSEKEKAFLCSQLLCITDYVLTHTHTTHSYQSLYGKKAWKSSSTFLPLLRKSPSSYLQKMRFSCVEKAKKQIATLTYILSLSGLDFASFPPSFFLRERHMNSSFFLLNTEHIFPVLPLFSLPSSFISFIFSIAFIFFEEQNAIWILCDWVWVLR